MEAADGVLGVHRTVRPRRPAILDGIGDQLELDAVGVVKHKRVGVGSSDQPVVDAELVEPGAPEPERTGRHLKRNGGEGGLGYFPAFL